MRTTYLTTLTTSFNPFSRTSHVPRLFLQLLPVKAHKDMKIKHNVLPRSSILPATLELGFKDGAKMTYSWTERVKKPKAVVADGAQELKRETPEASTQLADIVEEVDRHARVLARKEELSG